MTAYACPGCGRQLRVAEGRGGRKARCPACAGVSLVPARALASAAGGPLGAGAPPPPVEAEVLPPAGPPVEEAAAPPAPGGEPATVPPAPADGVAAPAVRAEGVPGYEILGRLGEGGMGVVYKARQLKPSRLVALKMILAGGHAGEGALARFGTEAEAIARLQHPNIVQVFEVGEHEGRPFFSLEFCPGGSLDRQLDGTPWQPNRAAKLVQTLARAMHAAHQAHVIHRDLKPANVLRTGDGTPKITDFGLAKKLDEVGQTASNVIMGTPSYMAPEQAEGKNKEVGPGCDVYALGAILYELLTTRPPFKAATPLDTILQVVADEPVPPRRLNAKVPADLETICLKCLQKQPGKRYASALALAEDLRRFRAGEPIKARPVGRVERGVKWVRRNPAVAGLLAALLVGAGAATLFAFQAEQRRVEAEAERDKAKFQALRAENARHANQIGQALRAWERHDVAEAERVLGEVDEAFQQTWEQRHLRDLCRRKALPLVGHRGGVASVAFSADGKRIASGSGDQTVKVWDTTTGQEKLSLQGHTSSVGSVAFSADGKRIASGAGGWNQPGEVKVWDAATGKQLHSLKGHTDGVTSVAFSADGKRLASGSGGFDPKTRKGRGEVKVWDAATGQELHSLKGHTDGVTSVALSADGKRLASGSDDKTVKVWDTATGRELLSLKGHTLVRGVAFSPDGRRLASGNLDQTVKVWDAATGQELLSLKGHTGPVLSVAFGPDGKRILTGSWDQTAKVWDAATGQELLSLKGHTGIVNCVALSPDGKRIVSGGEDKTLKVWDAATGQPMRSLRGHTLPVRGVAISADGKRVVSGSQDRTVKVWDAAAGKELLSLKGHTAAVFSVALSADGKRLASGSWDRTVRVWDAATGQQTLSLKGHTKSVTSVAFSADGRRIASGYFDGTVKLWDVATGQQKLSFKGHTDVVHSVTFSADGQHLVSGGAGVDPTTRKYGGEVKVWDAPMLK